MSGTGVEALERRVGHSFRDAALLERALTHSSLSADRRVRDLERLEFLGDRVLGLFAAEALWRRYPDMEEGELAPRFNALVRKETCAKAAVALGLDQLVKMALHEEESGGRRKAAILGDACEAFLGALYIDGGLDAARRAFDLFWTPNLESLSRAHRDAKTALQEWSQERKKGAPRYVVTASGGPAHAPAFEVEVRIDGYKPANGEGRSKREAQMAAAEAFLIREGVWDENE
ncbi:MAG TPA: ribonuclease III [Parvularculaceae bacterium]|nr:ribonuclease III [Parvularculaceae bacterium]